MLELKKQLNQAIIEFALDTENPLKNYNAASVYYNLKQYSAAISFYFRCAERTDDKKLAYTCLLKVANCFEILGDRTNTLKVLYKHCINLMPKRPEAYFFLSRLHENRKEYIDGYFFSELGLNTCVDETPLPDDVGYPGKYALIFEKAVCAWWWGKFAESRKLFHFLVDEYAGKINNFYLDLIQINLSSIGSGPESQVFRPYNKSRYANLRYKFPGSESIKSNFSQVFQDFFVLSMLNGKTNGTYFEIGSSKPFLGNNTALLELEYNWTGLGVEYKQELVQEYRSQRKNPVLLADATKINYNEILGQISNNGYVDYLQLDCEPSKTTFEILLMIPFDKYKFGVITYEHDHYVDVTKTFRQKSRNYLTSLGYELVVSDVSPDGLSTFEDWWVNPELVDRNIINKMKDLNGIKRIEDYFFPN